MEVLSLRWPYSTTTSAPQALGSWTANNLTPPWPGRFPPYLFPDRSSDVRPVTRLRPGTRDPCSEGGGEGGPVTRLRPGTREPCSEGGGEGGDAPNNSLGGGSRACCAKTIKQ